jgi:eukaryotic-like serine/threonine-protein kinase
VAASSSFGLSGSGLGETTAPRNLSLAAGDEVSEALLERSLERAGYRLENILGEGGMGRVYGATQVSMGRKVAIKTLLSRLTGDETFVSRFLREARISALLKNPHAVLVIDGGRSDCGVPYFVMERLVGQTLKERITDRGPLPIAMAIGAMTNVAEALVEAHALGVLHRDVKPSNVFENKNPRNGKTVIKLIDFGAGKLRADASLFLTRPGVCVGSAAYMAPEQALDPAGTDERADVFGVGATLHTLLSGQAPFGAHRNPRILERPRPALPWAEVDEVIARCVHWDPRGRYKSMKALVTALRGVALGRAPR